ncbi:hypothetical protein [Paeniglutamicibacter sp. NPDC091659]|uniref:hypothetical protein n=1 Tax=Paeniglutamicibacter sp. NPDC091659 TaxID=3364389 RepID=UPI0038238E41
MGAPSRKVLVAGLPIALLVALALWILPGLKWDKAMDACMRSDGGATGFEIQWSYLPTGYLCTTSDREPGNEHLIPFLTL